MLSMIVSSTIVDMFCSDEGYRDVNVAHLLGQVGFYFIQTC